MSDEVVDPRAQKSRAWKRLARVLDELDPAAAAASPSGALEPIGVWIRERGSVPLPNGDRAKGLDPRLARLRLLICALQGTPAWREKAQAEVRAVVEGSKALHLFCRTGLPEDAGFVGEVVGRALRSIVPVARDDRDLTEVLARLFPRSRDLDWLETVPPEMIAELLSVLTSKESDTFRHLRGEAHEAIALLATRLSALGLAEDVRSRSPACLPRSSPFFRLSRAYDAFLEAEDEARRAETSVACVALHAECREVVRAVLGELEHRGVSVDVVYHVDMIERCLRRLEALLFILAPVAPVAPGSGPAADSVAREPARVAIAFVVALCRDRLRDQTVLGLVRRNLQLLARKIIERAGHTGEHYITSSRAEYRTMLLSAGGGGVLTAGTTILKFWIAALALPLLVEGVLSGINYAGSFLLMQLLGCTLATKQPSMTAAALAGAMRSAETGGDRHGELVTMIARIARSQLAAAIGNIGMVIPAALTVEWISRAMSGTSILSESTAKYVLQSLDPLNSGTIPYAALTGGILWLSSVAAGWVENWAVLWRVPEGIARGPISRIFGKRAGEWLGAAFARNVSGIGGNTALGMFLGMTPVLGKFSGLPLDVRHVTLSTGALVLAAASLGGDALGVETLALPMLGIVIIGALNFGVSFTLALSVALRARDVTLADRLRLLRDVAARMWSSPLEFIFPPRDEAEDVEVGAPQPIAAPLHRDD